MSDFDTDSEHHFDAPDARHKTRLPRPQRGRAVFLMHLLRAASCAAVVAVSGCAYYPYPVATSAPASFDRSFSAAGGAMRDQGLAISVEDRASGTVVGGIGGGTVTARVLQQADGSVRVQFDATGPRDPALIDRVSRSYDSRMGR